MTTPEPDASHEPDANDAQDNSPLQPDIFTDPAATERAFQEIVSGLSDLSTNGANDETKRANTAQHEPRSLASQVDAHDDAGSNFDAGHHATVAPHGPRDWQDSPEIVAQIDGFMEPNPEFQLSKDPVRNLGWFLSGLSLIGLFGSAIFMRTASAGTYLVLGALFILGAGLLIWRMPTTRHHDNDSGAQV